MKKALVIGSPGAGKTTFARRLAQKTGLPLIHLDYYYHDKSKDYYSEKNKPAWYAEVRQLMKRKSWIMDGNYSTTFPERFEEADTIFFFDFPLRLRLYGIFRRRLQFHKKQRYDMPDDWQEKITWEFFKFVWNFESYRPKITSVINQKNGKKIITFKTRTDAQNYLNSLKTSVK